MSLLQMELLVDEVRVRHRNQVLTKFGSEIRKARELGLAGDIQQLERAARLAGSAYLFLNFLEEEQYVGM